MSKATMVQRELAEIPTSRFVPTEPEEWQRTAILAGAIGTVSKVLASKHMEVRDVIHLAAEHVRSKQQFKKGRPILALAKKGMVQARSRTDIGQRGVGRTFAQLPDYLKEEYRAAIEGKALYDAGAEFTFGRLDKYLVDEEAPAPYSPVRRAEARAALHACGLAIGADEFVQGIGIDEVKLNPVAGAGFPVMGKLAESDVLREVFRIANQLKYGLYQAYDSDGREGVIEWKRGLETSNPQLVALRGKAKADMYTSQKVENKEFRFYNEGPKPIWLLMQTATQPFEERCSNAQQDPSVRTVIGSRFMGQGPEQLVANLQAQVEATGYGYLHCGDDSWAAVMLKGTIVLFSVDCSSFDLTQHAAVTKQVHEVVHDELEKLGGAAAALWYAYMRERLVVTVTDIPALWKHGGPSGMPLQSKVNDLLMEVYLARLRPELKKLDEKLWEDPSYEGYTSQARPLIGAIVEKVGKGMGFSVRLEDLFASDDRTVKDSLRQVPFLFVGYYFHVEDKVDGDVRVMLDLKRQLTQLPFPPMKWVKKTADLQVREAMRMGALAISWGLPTQELRPAVEAFRTYAVEQLERALKSGDLEDDSLTWAVTQGEAVFGPDLVPNISGLLAAVRNVEAIWTAERELFSKTTMVRVSNPAYTAERARLVQKPSSGEAAPPGRIGRPPPDPAAAERRARRAQQLAQKRLWDEALGIRSSRRKATAAGGAAVAFGEEDDDMSDLEGDDFYDRFSEGDDEMESVSSAAETVWSE